MDRETKFLSSFSGSRKFHMQFHTKVSMQLVIKGLACHYSCQMHGFMVKES